MTKESKILVVAVLLCTFALGAFQYFMFVRLFAVNLQSARTVAGASTALNRTLENLTATPRPTPSATATPAATLKGKSATASAALKEKVTPAPSPSAEATPEE